MIKTLKIILVMTSIGALVGVSCSNIRVVETAKREGCHRTPDRPAAADLSLSRPIGPFSTPANVAPIVTRHVAELNLQPGRRISLAASTRCRCAWQRLTRWLSTPCSSPSSGRDPIQQ